MNVQALDKLIADVRNCDPDEFDMVFHSKCMLSFIRPGEFSNTYDASAILDISEDDSQELFLNYPEQATFPNNKIYPGNAVKVLEYYRDTLKVDWSKAYD